MDANSDPHEYSGFRECPLLVGYERQVLTGKRTLKRKFSNRLVRERVVDEVQRRKFLTTAGLLLAAVAASGRPTE